MTDAPLWHIRHFIYFHLVDTTRPPSVDETARHFNISVEEAGALYEELADRHAIFLEPETLTVRMAWPFSGVATDFKVRADGKTYFANCAWDMLGIPAALHSDAVIEAVFAESNESVQLEVKDGRLCADVRERPLRQRETPLRQRKRRSLASDWRSKEISDPQPLVHFPLPFTRWYDDLVFT